MKTQYLANAVMFAKGEDAHREALSQKEFYERLGNEIHSRLWENIAACIHIAETHTYPTHQDHLQSSVKSN